jgi:diguanylate cyclase (GGDEF)-like protein
MPAAVRSSTSASGRETAVARGVESWRDADKVLLVSSLTLPFALGWALRCLQLQDDPTRSSYVSRDFLPTILPFLWIQVAGHALLILAALAIRRRASRRAAWLVHAEVQFWFVCLSISLYNVGTFTSPFGVLILVLPVVGYLLFEPWPMHFGLMTMSLGTLAGIALPMLGVAPYAPFLAHAPFADHHLEPAWVMSFGIPSIFATVVGIVIHTRLVRRLRERQAELERLSSTDTLTGLANRTVFYRRLDEELARARRHGLPLCVLMIDVDHFKTINDTRGHLIGDQVLRELGHALRAALRTGDIPARYGGEEFAVLLPHTVAAEAATVATRLLDAARALGDADAPITLSIGSAELAAGETSDSLVGRADAALYASKRSGRDRLTRSEAPL